MKDIFSISKLIIKKKLKFLSDNEKSRLKQYYKTHPFSKDVDFEYIVQKITDYSAINNDKAWNSVLEKSKRSHKKSQFYISMQSWLKYAAILIGIIGITYFFIIQNKTTDIQDGQLIIAEENIILELDNGNTKIIDAKKEEKILDKSGNTIASQKGSTLDYLIDNTVEKLVYNKLTVPYGKKFQIVLSDGTKVHLNAGTSLKYPVKFIKGENRQVYLLNGEAYFDVTEDSNHPFIVNTNEINVRVLGTEFNISSYPEDPAISTVLVEGAVSLYGNDEVFNKANASVLNPGYKASWDKTTKNISIDEVDISIYMAWIEGKLIFKDTPFKIIRKKLERHYNVSIINNDKQLDENTYSAVFDIETIEKVLQTLNESYEIKYSIINNQIIIN